MDDFDIESQGSSATASSGDAGTTRLPRRPIGINVAPGVKDNFVKKYGFEPILRTGEPFHEHPYLATERSQLEAHALKLAGDGTCVWDVGSAARRHDKRRVLHCLCPQMQPGDAERLQRAIRSGNTVCQHKLQDWCSCGAEPDVFLFTHSAYYFTPAELVEAVNRCRKRVIYVVGHLFTDPYGSLGEGEAQYSQDLRSSTLMITMKVRGNDHSYYHPPLPWDGRVAVVGDVCLDVRREATMGDTYLWTVRLAPRPEVLAPEMDWRGAVVDPSHVGPIHVPGWDAVTRQSMAANHVLSVEVDCVYGKGGWLFGETRSGRVFVPKGLVERVAREMHGKPRDPATLRDVIYSCQRAISSSRLPEGERLMSQTFAAALAFNINVRNEIDTLNTITSRYSTVWKTHAMLTSLTPLRVCRLTTILVWAAIAGGAGLVYLIGGPWQAHWVGGAELALTGLVTSLFLLAFCFKKWQSRRTSDNWSSTLMHEQRVSHITGGSMVPARTTFRAFEGLRAPLLPRSGRLEVLPDPHPPRHPGTTRTPLTLQGIGVATAVPTVPRTDADAEITAITHRMLTPPTVVEPTALDKFFNLESTPEGRVLLDLRIEGSHDMYEKWINQDKFSLSQREKFRREYDKHVKGGQRPKPGMAFNSFVKLEKMKSTTPGDPLVEGLKTRLINGPPDAVKVAVGPWTARLYEAVRRVWDGRQCRILYASGMTPDAIGAVCDDFAARHGGWDNIFGVWDDEETYDSTLENELLGLRDVLYPRMGTPDHVMEWIHATSAKGIGSHGPVFELGKKVLAGTATPADLRRLLSGEMDTNLIGTLVNGLAHASGLPDVPYLMLVCGDDNIVFFPKDVPELTTVCENLREHLVALGLRPTQGFSDERAHWEFCSKLFWPARDRSTGRTVTVLGPKPGRWLSRIGWAINKPDALNFRGTMISSSQDVRHIPLLNAYTMKGLELSRGMKMRGREEYSPFKHVTRAYDEHPDAVKLLYRRYGISAEHVLAFETVLKSCNQVPIVIDVPWLAAAVKTDE